MNELPKYTFQELFQELIRESQLFTIEYEHNYSHYKEYRLIDFKIISVNNCFSEIEFRKKIHSLIKEPLRHIREILSEIPDSQKYDYLENIKYEIENLKYLVEEDSIVYNQTEYSEREEYYYKTFCNVLLKGTIDDKIEYYKKNILKRVESYAIEWIELINELKTKFDFLINHLELGGFENENNNYVDPSRINELDNLNSTKFDLTKLIQQCKELNSAFKNKNLFSVILLVRSIIDHIPPIFEKKNFQEVANNYGSKSFKESMERLDKSSRKIADSVLHQQIRAKEILPNLTQINFSNDLDILLSEIVRIMKN